MRLALALGFPNPDDMLAGMSSKQFSEWMAYDTLEPFGEIRADIRNAMLCAILVNINRGKNSKPAKLEDFMPTFDKKWMDEVQEELTLKDDKSLKRVLGLVSRKQTMRVYEGEAPGIRKLGKKALKKGSKRREWLNKILGRED